MRGVSHADERIRRRRSTLVEVAGGEWLDHAGEVHTQWHVHSTHDNPEFANQAREKLISGGITARLRGVLL
jgi:hypothetical protein